MRGVSTVLKVLSYMVYAIIICVLLLVAPMLFGHKPVVVLSRSMEPAMPVGSLVYYKATPFEEIEVGDTVTFRLGENGEFASHRVIEKDEVARAFTVKGDNNESPDPTPVPYDRVVGKVSKIVLPFVGFATAYLKNWFVIGTMGLILLLGILVPDDSEKKKKKRKRGNESGEVLEFGAGFAADAGQVRGKTGVR
jgi:signal peptidase